MMRTKTLISLNVILLFVLCGHVAQGANDLSVKENGTVKLNEENRILKVLMESSNADELHDAALQAGEMRLVEAVPALISLMKKSNSPTVWHGIGIAVNDLKDQRLLNSLVKLIQDAKTKGCRGTLVYGLEGLDCSSVLEWLVDLYVNDSYEVRMSAYGCIENIDMEKIEQERIKTCIEKLQDAKNRGANKEDIEVLLELF